MKSLLKSARMRVAFALLASLGSASSWAAADCSQTVGSTITLQMPSTITVPRDAAIGAPLTGWVSSASTTWFNCTQSEGSGTGTGFQATNGMASQMVTVDGALYRVFKTGMAGIGVILSSRHFDSGCGWTPFSAVTVDWNATACNAAGAVTNGGELRAMLVKSAAIESGVLSATMVARVALFTNVLNGPLVQHPSLGFTFLTTAVNVVSQACLTPDVSVFLGPHKTAIFTGLGSSSPAVSFDISLNGCPAGLSAIEYRIDAVTPILDPDYAVVGLDAGSSATGVGVQLLDANDNPAILGVTRPFAGYNTATGGDFKIPLRARYRQTGSTVTPGSANTAVTFTVNYL